MVGRPLFLQVASHGQPLEGSNLQGLVETSECIVGSLGLGRRDRNALRTPLRQKNRGWHQLSMASCWGPCSVPGKAFLRDSMLVGIRVWPIGFVQLVTHEYAANFDLQRCRVYAKQCVGEMQRYFMSTLGFLTYLCLLIDTTLSIEMAEFAFNFLKHLLGRISAQRHLADNEICRSDGGAVVFTPNAGVAGTNVFLPKFALQAFTRGAASIVAIRSQCMDASMSISCFVVCFSGSGAPSQQLWSRPLVSIVVGEGQVRWGMLWFVLRFRLYSMPNKRADSR